MASEITAVLRTPTVSRLSDGVNDRNVVLEDQSVLGPAAVEESLPAFALRERDAHREQPHDDV